MADRPRARYGPDPGAFRAAFGVGATGDEIHPVDGLGVILASIQGLHELVAEHADAVDGLHRQLVAAERTSHPPR